MSQKNEIKWSNPMFVLNILEYPDPNFESNTSSIINTTDNNTISWNCIVKCCQVLLKEQLLLILHVFWYLYIVQIALFSRCLFSSKPDATLILLLQFSGWRRCKQVVNTIWIYIYDNETNAHCRNSKINESRPMKAGWKLLCRKMKMK